MAEPVDPIEASVALTARIAAGDEHAFARFYEAWFGSTLALARAVSRRDEAWCLDVVQDVMLSVVRGMPALDAAEKLRAWMTRTVVRAVTDRARSEGRRRRREQAVAGPVDGPAGPEPHSGRPEPWADLCEQERTAWLAASVAALPATDRALLDARFGEGATVTAVAEQLGMSADAAHGRLRRALDKLRRKAAEWWHAS